MAKPFRLIKKIITDMYVNTFLASRKPTRAFIKLGKSFSNLVYFEGICAEINNVDVSELD